MRLRPTVLSLAVASALVLGACGSKTVQPDGSVVGTMSPGTLPEVNIDGKAFRLAPGARIYNAQNLTITPNQVPANSRVRYKLDAGGNVNQVWLLPPER
jgi:hypothetical protein